MQWCMFCFPVKSDKEKILCIVWRFNFEASQEVCFYFSHSIQTFCATDWEMFHIGSRVFLVVANGHRLHLNGPSQYAINSTIYELDMNGQMFVRFQDIVTYR